ncbi:DJ-1/PfpI family protein [Streptomyces sp. GbtcB6]|uniref:DJ-1/PfpI family protein n=1 Tax=Streptomyces sp. GbtcB6 TaxID=2824751 RepID=UPI001C2F701C|nr:DJ-1/PfpI family protein [Streptomyces sp. GbtcB6]
MTRVAVLAYEGVDELDLAGVYGPLAKAARCVLHGGELEVLLAGPAADFRTSGGLRMTGAEPLAVLASCGALVVPGGRGAERAAAAPELTEAVRGAAGRGTALFSVCSGALVVAAAGVRVARCAIHRNKRDLLRPLTFAEISQGIVREPELVSAGGLSGRGVKAVDIAFEVLRRFTPWCVRCVSERMETVPPPAT